MSSGKHRKARGWWYRGEHFDKPLTVEYLIEACKPTPRERCATLIGTVLKKLQFFGFVPDGTDPKTVTATLEIVPQPFDYTPVAHGDPYTIESLMKMRSKAWEDR